MRKQIALLLFTAISFTVSAQSIEEQLTQRRVSCYDLIANAAEVLPALYETRSFDSIQTALHIAQRYCDSNAAPLFYIQTLLNIEQSRFSINDISKNENFTDWLESYAIRFNVYHASSSARSYFYYNDNAQGKLYKLIQVWASNLLAAGNLSNNESFICNVLAGNIKNPQAIIKANKEKYPDLYASLRQKFSNIRSHPDANAAFVCGPWLPNGKAKLLGVHPQAGFQVGGRSKHNELDLTLLFRFAHAANYYNVLRRDSLYKTNHFLGGYIGFDYTRYLVHTTNFEIGLTAGIGYDGFDILDSDKYYERKNDLDPYTIGSLNLNAGMRFNYYFNPHLYIGIGGRYNKVNYKNSGGTNLKGNAVSIDFFIGGS